MFADPQTINIDGESMNLPRVSTQGRTSVYESASGDLTLIINHVNGKRARSIVRVNHSKVAPDSFNPSTNKPYTMSTYLVVDSPLNIGYTDAELRSHIEGLIDLVGTPGFLDKFLGQES